MSVHNQGGPAVYWIGGSPCSGKTSIAHLLSEWHDLPVHSCDDGFYQHAADASPSRHPTLWKLNRMPWEEIFLRPVGDMVDDVVQAYREEWVFHLTELKASYTGIPIIAEGAALLPGLLADAGINSQHVIYVLPTEDFQRHTYAQRDWAHEIAAETSDPDQAFDNWMQRDADFARWLTVEAIRYGFRSLTVDGSLTIEDHAADISRWFGLSS